MYYLQSRYYDPVVGRFINADDAILLNFNLHSITGNCFRYCNNSPIINEDSNGYFAIRIVTAIVGGILAALVYLLIDGLFYFIKNKRSLKAYKINGWKVAWEFSWGMLSGAFMPTDLSRKSMAIIGGVTNALKEFFAGVVNKPNMSIADRLGKLCTDFLIGLLLGWIAGPGIKSRLVKKFKISYVGGTNCIEVGEITWEASYRNIVIFIGTLWDYIKSLILGNVISNL